MIYHHIYNRGAHKALIFHDNEDYNRMLKLLYIANCSTPFTMRDFGSKNIFEIPRKDTLVSILAYCLMPNHIHIAICEDETRSSEKNITKFIRKLCTGYSSYYNKKYSHAGTIWQGSYREKASDKDTYLQILVSYIHLNPSNKKISLTKKEADKKLQEIIELAKNYEYSSLKDYIEISRNSVENKNNLILRPQMVILDTELIRKLKNCE